MHLTLKHRIARIYFKTINALHHPFVKHGADDPYHGVFQTLISLTQTIDSPSILEVGSRNVTGITRRELFKNCEHYVGFDVLEGPGVDVVGDAHLLSNYFSTNEFDFVYSISVFEHLLTPWKAVLEINKVLKTGGYVFLSTHPVWPAHELPWDFWRFPSQGFHSLFNQYTGFEIIDNIEGLPCKIYSLVDDGPTQTNWHNTLNQGVAVIAKKVADYRSDLLKWDVKTDKILDTMYPENKSQ